MKRAVGDPCGLTYDGPPVEVGDYLRTTSTGRYYLVMGVRVQQHGKHAGRQHIKAVVMGTNCTPESDARVLPIRWYKR